MVYYYTRDEISKTTGGVWVILGYKISLSFRGNDFRIYVNQGRKYLLSPLVMKKQMDEYYYSGIFRQYESFLVSSEIVSLEGMVTAL